MAGHFIVIDGPDGAGKGTQIELLKKVLPTRYGRPPEDFVFTREPGGSPRAEYIRGLILDEQMKGASGAVMIQLFGAARLDHLEETIVPALAAGKVVVSDRFDASTYAYQLVAQNGGKAAQEIFSTQRILIANLECFSGKGWTTIVLDVQPWVSRERLASRGGEKLTHFDTRPMEFHVGVANGYRDYERRYSGVRFVNASRTPCLVHHDIIDIFDRVLGGPKPVG